MYESPIAVSFIDDANKIFVEKVEDAIVAKVRGVVHIDVDKDELAKALQYDRDQYDRGYAQGRIDGHASGYKERDDEIVRCKDCTLARKYKDGVLCVAHNWSFSHEYFCAWGQRKEQDT